MIYVPMLKTRKEEMRVAKALNYCFCDNIIPIFEIINDIYKDKFEVDPETHKVLYEIKPGNKVRRKVKAKKTSSHEA
jgi:hypothetical protein